MLTTQGHLDPSLLLGSPPRPDSFNGHGYHLFQAMRFSVEQINNSTALLPNVSLGYELYDTCSDSATVYAVLHALAQQGTNHVEIQENLYRYSPKVVAFIGPDDTEDSATAAALLSPFLVPLVSCSLLGWWRALLCPLRLVWALASGKILL